MTTPSARGESALNATPANSSPLILRGKIVPMTGAVIADGAVYCRHGEIEFVRSAGEPIPAGYDSATKLETNGVIYPGLIDLHSHLNYNVLPLWNPPKAYDDRYQWRRDSRYKQAVTQTMQRIVAKKLSFPVIRYVETRLLVGGTTASQGMPLRNAAAYRGMVRNFERTDDPKYPAIATELEDWAEIRSDSDRTAMREQIEAGQRFFHHLAEGRKGGAPKAYEDIKRENLLLPNYVGIHCTGLTGSDYDYFAGKRAKAVWSPTSNFLLYGATVEIERFIASGVRWGLGSDWSPSGPKNLLGEMKMAWLAAKDAGVRLDYETLAKSVTLHAAEVLGWDERLGKIAPACGADLLVLKSTFADPYENLVRATERDIVLVTIEGVPRYGDEALMLRTGIPSEKLEPCTIAGRKRRIYFEHPDALPAMNALSLGKATAALEAGMADLASPAPPEFLKSFSLPDAELELELDMDTPPSEANFADEGTSKMKILAADPLPPLTSVPLSKLTAVDDPGFFDAMEAIPDRPNFLRELRRFYF